MLKAQRHRLQRSYHQVPATENLGDQTEGDELEESAHLQTNDVMGPERRKLKR